MKNTILIFMFFAVGNINAQIINIPNANFKAKLLQANTTNFIAQDASTNSIVIDSNSNGEIEVNEALLVYTLDVSNSNITSLQGLSSFTNLVQLFCNNNQLATLDISSNINLFFINCSNNFLTTLDTSSIINLFMGVNCNNNQLTTINLKGIGSNFIYGFNGLSYANNPSLNYICIRDSIPELTNYILDSNAIVGLTSCVVNSYCSFTPGGIFYTIQGFTKYDDENNGCDASDAFIPNIKFTITDGAINGTVIANTIGNYTLPVQAGTHTITPIVENSSYFIISPSSSSITFPITISPFNQNFCISPNGIHNDLAVELIPISVSRPVLMPCIKSSTEIKVHKPNLVT